MIQISEKVNFGEFDLVRFRTPFDAIITRINGIDSKKTARSIKDEINRENIIDINNQEFTNLCNIIKQKGPLIIVLMSFLLLGNLFM